MGTSSEDVLLVMNNVRHKKNDGALYIMASRVAWMPDGKEVLAISHNYCDIKLQKISPEGKAKVQLQLVLGNNESTTFRFINPSGPVAQIADRNQVKDCLMQLLPKFKKKISNDLEEKQKFLQDDPKLFELYSNLVVGKIIPAEKFWQTYMPKKEEVQPIGVVGSFLVDVKPEASDGGAGFKYNLTTDTIDNIFKTYPTVESKYLDYVPHRLSEAEFWTAFFQSHYFHRDRITLGSKDLFAECSRQDDSEMKSAANRELPNPLFDLRLHMDSNFSDLHSSTPTVDSTKLTPNQALIKRFNHHSLMVVKSSKASIDKDGKQMKILEKTEYPDLEETKVSRTGINLAEPAKYQSGPIVDIIEHLPLGETENILTSLACRISDWPTDTTRTFVSSSALTALGDLSPNGQLMKHVTGHRSNSKLAVPEEVLRELFHVQIELNELLRHFWQCFPITSGELERKLENSKNSIENFKQRRFEPLYEDLSNKHQGSEFAVHVREMIDAALSKFIAWRKKKKNFSAALDDQLIFDSMEL